MAHLSSLAYALDWAAMLHRFRREVEAAQERAAAAITLSTEQGFALYGAWGTIVRGWSLAEQGQGAEGTAQIHQGLAFSRASGIQAVLPYHFALLAEAYGKAGQGEEGLRVLAEALTMVNSTGERNYEAELYRLKGELMLQQSSVQSLGSGVQTKQTAKDKKQKAKITALRSLLPAPHAEAEACFLKAIEIARRQEAKSLELRAVMSLARLWQHQGKCEAAHELLAPIYGWFTEGFDTADLQEAKGLLKALL